MGTDVVDIKSASPQQAVIFKDLDQVLRASELMANAKHMVPDHFIGNPGGCMAIIMQAQRWGMDPFVVAGKTHIVQGRLGYEAQLVNAVVQNSGMIVGGFKYEFRGEGPSLECRVGARLKGEQDITWGEWLASADVKVKNSPLWKTNEKQQLGYLQCKNWARLYCPGAILGVYTSDELQHAAPIKDVTPAKPEPQSRAAALKRRLEEQEAPAEEEVSDNPYADTTFAQMAEQINASESVDALFDLTAGIQEFLTYADNNKYRAELLDVYQARKAKLEAEAAEQGAEAPTE